MTPVVPLLRLPLVVALAAQLAAGAAVFGGAFALNSAAGVVPPFFALLALQGVLAAFLGHRFGLAHWWLPIQLALPPGIAAALVWQVPAWIFLAAFLGLVFVFWNSARGGVPLYLTNRETWAALAQLLPEGAGFRFIDLGSGLGGTLADLSRRRPDGRFTGIESAPTLFAFTWLRFRFPKASNIDHRYGDYRCFELTPFDVVYCFLSPVPMPALYEKARREMRPGSLLISNSFEVPGRPADEIVEVGDRRGTRLYLWRL